MEKNVGFKSDPYLIDRFLVFGLIIIFFILILLIGPFLYSNIASAHDTDSSEIAISDFISPYNRSVSIIQELIDGEMAYIAYIEGFSEGEEIYGIAAINLSDPIPHGIVWSMSFPQDIEHLALESPFLYITTSAGGLWVVDLNAPNGPRLQELEPSQEIQTKRRLRSNDALNPYNTSLSTYNFPQYNTSSYLNNWINYPGTSLGSIGSGFGFPQYNQFSIWPQTNLWNQPWGTYGLTGFQTYMPSLYGSSFGSPSLLGGYTYTWPYSALGLGVTSYTGITGFLGTGSYTIPYVPVQSSKPSKTSTPAAKYRSPVPITLSLDNPSESQVTGEITLRLKDLNEKTVSDQMKTLTLEPGLTDYKIILDKVPENTGTEDFAKYILSYSFDSEGVSFSKQKSLFQVADKMEVRIIGPDSVYAGQPTTIGVHAFIHGQPVSLEGASIAVDLIKGKSSKRMFTDTTDEDGFAEARLDIPDEIGPWKIRAKVNSDLGSETITEDIEIVRLYKILLTTDKPIYQPGQTIHIRTLTLKKPELLPETNQEIILEVEDPKANKVFRVNPQTDDFGVASADFSLGTDINLGLYTVRAIVMEDEVSTQSEKKVNVERYVLPKFKVDLNTDAEYYSPGDNVHGTVHAGYFFGKDLVDATVTIEASKYDVDFVLFQTITGQTDADGFFSFDLILPSYFVGLPLEQGNAFVKLDIKVEDTAEHEEAIVRELTVTKDPILIKLIPESGSIVPGLENILYIITTDPKGRGIATTNLINYAGQILNVNTDHQGVGSFTVTPDEGSQLLFQIASQADGQSALVEINLSDAIDQAKILLRTDKAIYKVGETMTIDVSTPEFMARRVFLDIIRDRQTILTKGVDIINGQGQLIQDIDNDMAGTLLIEAYYISLATETASDVFRDKKTVYVNPALDIEVMVTMDQDQYLPGEKAGIGFQVSPPQTAALGITIVDEAVYSLQENQPGLLKVYFSMEKEIMKPRFWPLIVPYEEAVTSEDPDEEVQEMAQIVFASAEEPDDPGLNESSYPDLVQRMKEALVSRINKDADKVAKDLGNQNIYSEWTYNSALSRGMIKTYNDPWGNAYKLEVGYNQVILTSNGPDEKSGTIDDTSLTKPYRPVYQRYTSSGSGSGSGSGGGSVGIWGFPTTWAWSSPSMFLFPATPSFTFSGSSLSSGIGSTTRQATAYSADYGSSYTSSSGGSVDGTYVPDTSAGFLTPTQTGGEESPGEELETQEPRKIRRDFPETLLWEPSLITDPNGMAYMDTNMADSITTWRMSATASTIDGKLGGKTEEIVVFQDFFIDLDLPVTLTQDDEISMPVAIYNYMEEPQTVRIKLEVEQSNPWFDLMDTSEKLVDLEAGEVTVVYFRIKAVEVGWHDLTVFGYGTRMSDAISRSIEVLPNGMEFYVNVSDRMNGNQTSHVLNIPEDAIDGASKILVKVYPGIFSQMVEGLEKMLKVPNG